jgi:hypothetical protein
MKLTQEQRAKRATSRRNNEIARRYPLFATQFAETVEQNLDRIRQQDVVIQAYFKRLEEEGIEAYCRGELRRAVVAARVSVDVLDDMDNTFRRHHPNRSQSDIGAYYADYWWHKVKVFDPEWAVNNCPNNCYHGLPKWGINGVCVTCGWSADKVNYV